MNQSVHVFMRGCLTLKFSGSWKTVRTSSLFVVALVDDFSLLSPEPPVGEMGIVSSGTCWSGFGAVATSAIVDVFDVLVERNEIVVDSQSQVAGEVVCSCAAVVGVFAGGWWAVMAWKWGSRSRAGRFCRWLQSRGRD